MSRFTRSDILLACAGLLALSACGGGSGGGGNSAPTETPPPSAAPNTTAVEVKVIDGALANAQVFLDKNGNGALHEGEPSARSNAAGLATLTVPDEDVGKAPVVALVGTDAVDADSGPVTVPYALRAPADSTAVVSPLTTIVQRIIEDSGVSTAEAEAAAKGQTSLAASMLADYTADATPAGRSAAMTARLVVVAIQQHIGALAPAAGSTDLGGATITRADIDKAILGSVVQSFQELVSAAQSPAVQGACGSIGAADCDAALQAQATQVNGASGLTTASLPIVVAMARTPDTTPPESEPTAGAALSFLNFGDANNWYYRIFVATAEEATPDAQGKTRFRSISRAMSSGTLFEWGTGGAYARRDDVHWNGGAWVTCPFGLQMAQDMRDANGRVATIDYCDGLETSSSQRYTVDISNRSMSEIVAAIQASLPSHASWGSPPAGFVGSSTLNLGSAAFPAGSKMLSQTTTVKATAYAYDVTSKVLRYAPGVAAGGDTRTNPGSACLDSALTGNPFEAQSLEDMMDGFRIRPCIYGPGTFVSSGSPTPLKSLDPDEWWSNSTLSIGVLGSVPLVANPGSYYTGNTTVRVGFPGGGGNAVNYYSCLQRQVNGSSRNCTQIGTGSFAITTRGDSRVLTLINPPSLAAALDYERIFVERGGKVYYGYQSKLASRPSTRLNLTAANALFDQLGIPAVTP